MVQTSQVAMMVESVNCREDAPVASVERAATRSHPGPGHHREVPLSSTKDRSWKDWYFGSSSGEILATSSSVTSSLHRS